MSSKVEAIVSRKVWLEFLGQSQDLIVTGWEMAEVPPLMVVDEWALSYEPRKLYTLMYMGRKFLVWEDEVESMI